MSDDNPNPIINTSGTVPLKMPPAVAGSSFAGPLGSAITRKTQKEWESHLEEKIFVTSASKKAKTPAVNAGLPMHVIRIVCQMEDTQANRLLFEQVFKYIQSLPFPGTPKHAILKMEQIEIVAARRLLPNTEFRRVNPDSKIYET